MMGAERKSMAMSEEEKKLTAYHEAGHAIVASMCRPASRSTSNDYPARPRARHGEVPARG